MTWLIDIFLLIVAWKLWKNVSFLSDRRMKDSHIEYNTRQLPIQSLEGLAEPAKPAEQAPEQPTEPQYFEPVSDRLKKVTKGQLHDYTDDELLRIVLNRTDYNPITDELYSLDSAALNFDDSLNSDIIKRQQKAGQSAFRGSRVLFDQVKEDYAVNIEDKTPWWALDD
jgi:hypothetical protein